jgi:hypothetical protein
MFKRDATGGVMVISPKKLKLMEKLSTRAIILGMYRTLKSIDHELSIQISKIKKINNCTKKNNEFKSMFRRELVRYNKKIHILI